MRSLRTRASGGKLDKDSEGLVSWVPQPASSTFRPPHLSPSLFCVPWPLAASPSLALGVHAEASQLSISSLSPQRGSCIVQGPALLEDLPAFGSLRPSLCGILHLVWLENPLLGPLTLPPLTQPCNCPITPVSVKSLTSCGPASLTRSTDACAVTHLPPPPSKPAPARPLHPWSPPWPPRPEPGLSALLPARLPLLRKHHAHLCTHTRRPSAC